MVDKLVIRFARESPPNTWFPCRKCAVLLHALKQDELLSEDASTGFVEHSGGALLVTKVTFHPPDSERDRRLDSAVVMRQKVDTRSQIFPKLTPGGDNRGKVREEAG